MGDRRDAHRVLEEKPERRPLERTRSKWEDNSKMYLREVGWRHGLDRPGSGQGEVAGCYECGNELSGL